MHKCLIVKSDYCDFNWWNSCLCLDAMVGYMNLKIIKLLMLNFTCLWCIYMYTCVLPINDEEWIVVNGLLMNSCLIDVVVDLWWNSWLWVVVVVNFISWIAYEVSCDEVVVFSWVWIKMGWLWFWCELNNLKWCK